MIVVHRASRTLGVFLLLAIAFLPAPRAAAEPAPWQRTEERAPCDDFDRLRTPYFGDTHVHTTYSYDAVTGDVRTGPRDAYRFGQGEPIGLPPYDAAGNPLRTVRLRRPLDFVVVTDHSEFFGEVQTCLTPGLPGYESSDCRAYRQAIPQTGQVTGPGVTTFSTTYLVPQNPERLAFCGTGGTNCLGQASLVWQDTQEAAEQFYDRTAACSFTTFVGYEWTGTTNIQNLHRNVIFRNDAVPDFPVSYVEEPTAQGLWASLRDQCLDGLARCDALVIPHNSNLSNGAMFRAENADGSPLTPADAAFRALMEPLVEITQHKGDSECRPGVLTNDELCGFEKWNATNIGLPAFPNAVYPPLLFVRNALKEGLVQEEALGVNPFRLGLIGSTDTHNSTPGLVDEEDYVAAGHLGTRDSTPDLMVSPLGIGVIGGIESNPGGLAVLWAEENSRDALFAAMRRREVYATSGPRPIVRFFAGRLAGLACQSGEFVRLGYKGGAPMGGEIGAAAGKKSPRFAVLALADPGDAGGKGTPLQRVQIVKGWVDGQGEAHERVFEVAGNPANRATVDTATCATSGPGFESLCAVWEDPSFDPDQRAFYYVRVVENPVCRWSTRLCNSAGIDCAAVVPAGYEQCCNTRIPKTIQERAWTSPVWYRPEAIATLKAKVKFGKNPGSDSLRLKAGIHRVPPDLDPTANPLTIRLRDDDTIWEVVIPPGTLTERKPGRSYVYQDYTGRLGGLKKAILSINAAGGATLKVSTVPIDLSPADRSEHMVEVGIETGALATTHTRLWEFKGGALASPKES
jgi:hypothetical protein